MSGAISIRAIWDSREVSRALDVRNIPFAMALALTRTGQRVKAEEQTAMRSAFDRPRPFTINSVALTRATKDKREARVWFKDVPGLDYQPHYLTAQIDGGRRAEQPLERALRGFGLGGRLVPAAGAKLDQYGNVTRSAKARTYNRLFGGGSPGKTSSRRGAFFGNIHGRAGIWERLDGTVRPMFLETREPSYPRRFDFSGIGKRVAHQHFASELESALAIAMRTRR